MIISRSVLVRNVSDKSCRENQNTSFHYICPTNAQYVSIIICFLQHSICWTNIVKSKKFTVHTWSDNKVCELIELKVLHTSLPNTTMVTFKVLPLGSYTPMPAPSPPFKQFWNWFCGMAFRAAIVLLLMLSMSSKCLPFNFSFMFGNRKSHWGLDQVNRHGVTTQLFVQQLKTPSQTVPCEQVHCCDARSMSCWQKVWVIPI